MAVVRDLSISETNSAGCAEDSVKETGWSLSVFFFVKVCLPIGYFF